jgi:DNA-binding response OmpR family regulator
MSMDRTILLVEDDSPTRELLRMAFTGSRLKLIEADSGESGLELLRHSNPDLVMLDVKLPGVSGTEVCRRIRAEGRRLPVIMLTASTDTIDVVVGLELGADDYVTKPFEVRELIARIWAQLRRSRPDRATPEAQSRFEFPGLVIDTDSRQTLLETNEIDLTPTEFNLLSLLVSQAGRVISRAELLRHAWGYEIDIETRTVDAHIHRLRKKIEPRADSRRYIEGIRGFGYRFKAA